MEEFRSLKTRILIYFVQRYSSAMQITLKNLPEASVTVEFITLQVLLRNAFVAKGVTKCIILDRSIASIYAHKLC